MKNLSTRNRFITILSTIFLLLIWQWAALATGSTHILPGPYDALLSLINLITETGFWPSVGLTLLRGIYGFFLAMVAGLLVGIWSGLNPKVEAAFRPILVSIRSVPVISIILLALIWFQVEQVPVFIGFLTMFPILSKNISEGIRQTDHGLIEMAKVYGVVLPRILKEIYLPSIIPWLLSGMSTAIGFGWRAIIIGEVLSQPRYGIGSMMQNAQSFLLVSELIAWTVIAVLISFIFETLLVRLEKRVVKWK